MGFIGWCLLRCVVSDLTKSIDEFRSSLVIIDTTKAAPLFDSCKIVSIILDFKQTEEEADNFQRISSRVMCKLVHKRWHVTLKSVRERKMATFMLMTASPQMSCSALTSTTSTDEHISPCKVFLPSKTNLLPLINNNSQLLAQTRINTFDSFCFGFIFLFPSCCSPFFASLFTVPFNQ